MSRPTAEVINRYQAKVYDRVSILIPKGRLADVKDYCSAHGETVNGLVNRLLMGEIGMDDAAWKSKPTEPDSAASTDSTHPGGYAYQAPTPQEPPRVPEILQRPL